MKVLAYLEKMFSLLLKHQWQQSVRSVMRKQQIAANIFVTMILFLLIVNIFGLAFALDTLLKLLLPDKDPVQIFNGFILYYLVFDLILRYIFQRVPDLEIYPYLLQPIKRAILAHFLIIKSFFSLFNLLPLLFLLPFLVKVIIPAYTVSAGIQWLLFIYMLALCNSLLNYYLKKSSLISGRILVTVLMILGVGVVLEIAGMVSLSIWSSTIFFWSINRPYFFIVSLLLFVAAYFLSYLFIKRHLKIASMTGAAGTSETVINFINIFNRISQVGIYLAMELKLLFRNKRPRAIFYSVFFLLVISVLIYLYLLRAAVYYPVPGLKVIDEVRSDNRVRVTFRIFPDYLPEKAHVYIAGNQEKFGRWHPGKTPLRMQSDSSWTRTFYFQKGQELKYKLTLGTWKTERLEPDGGVPEAYTYQVIKDSTITIQAAKWNRAPRSLFIDFNLVYFGLLITGMAMMMYGQLIFSWESNYFDLLNTLHLNFISYFRAKYLLLAASALVLFMVTLPFIVFNLQILLINIGLLLYNIGVNAFLLLFLAVFNRKRIDLNASIFSTQGKGSVQFLTIVPFLFIPLLIYISFALFDLSNTGYIILALLGLAGICAHRFLLRLLVRIFKMQRYKITMGFRNS